MNGATESGTTVTITTDSNGHRALVVGQQVTISGVSEPGYNGTFIVTAVPSKTTFQYTAPTSGLPNSGSGSASFLSTSTLTGGTYLISGTFQFTGANIVTNAANIVLNGPASAILNQSTGANALANFATNTAAGNFTIQNGRNFTTVGDFSNAGIVVVGGGSVFTTGGAGKYTQTGGTTSLAGGTLFTNLLDMQGGVLTGNGAVFGNLASAGQVNPGDSLGILSVVGDYIQAAGGAPQRRNRRPRLKPVRWARGERKCQR